MELRDPIRSVLTYKGGNVWSVPPSASVYDAIAMMGEKQVGALLVIEDAKLIGTFSERDYARKIVLKGRASKDTPVSEIMTSPVRYVTPEESVDECMRIMTANRVRPRSLALEHCDLVSQGKYLQGGVATRAEEDAECNQERKDEFGHELTVVTRHNAGSARHVDVLSGH